MKGFRTILIFVILGLITGSCSTENTIARRLEGMWTIDVYQKTVYGNNIPVIAESSSVNNAGTFEFLDDGSGWYNILKNLGTNTYTGDAEFFWTNTGTTVSIRTNMGTNTYELTESKSDRMIWERNVKNYYFPGSENGITYEMDERIVVTK